ncbi:MAG TPA: FecR family protein [Thermoanaerobaculia bacterium]
MRRTLSLLLLVLGGAAAAAAEPVGEVVLVRNEVRGQLAGGSARPLAAGDGLDLGLAITTGRSSGAKMTFDPRGALTLGSETRVVIDRTLVDRVSGRNESALSVLAGSVRLALSRLFQGEVEIATPTAVVGVKGTDVRIDVSGPDGLTIVSVLAGEVEVRGRAGGEVRVPAGRRTVVAPGMAPSPPGPLAPVDELLSAAAGGPAFTPPQRTVFPESPLLEGDACFAERCGPNDPGVLTDGF